MMKLAKQSVDPLPDRTFKPSSVGAAKMPDLILNDREQRILRLIGVGATNNEVAVELSTSRRSVTTDISKLLKKIGAPNRLQAALWAGVNL